MLRVILSLFITLFIASGPAFSQVQYDILNVPLCWTVNGQDSSIFKMVYVTSTGLVGDLGTFDVSLNSVTGATDSVVTGFCSTGSSGITVDSFLAKYDQHVYNYSDSIRQIIISDQQQLNIKTKDYFNVNNLDSAIWSFMPRGVLALDYPLFQIFQDSVSATESFFFSSSGLMEWAIDSDNDDDGGLGKGGNGFTWSRDGNNSQNTPLMQLFEDGFLILNTYPDSLWYGTKVWNLAMDIEGRVILDTTSNSSVVGISSTVPIDTGRFTLLVQSNDSIKKYPYQFADSIGLIPDTAFLGSIFIGPSGQVWKIQQTTPFSSDDITVQQKGSKYAVLQPRFDGWYHLNDFGAIGTDTIPDTTAVNRAIEFIVNSSIINKKLWIDDGDYYMYTKNTSANGIFEINSGSLVDGIHIAGNRGKARFVYTNSGNWNGSSGTTRVAFYIRRVSNFKVDGIEFMSAIPVDTSYTNGDPENDPYWSLGTALSFINGAPNSYNVEISNCNFHDLGGIAVQFNENDGRNFRLLNCEFRDIIRDASDGAIGDPTGLLASGDRTNGLLVDNCQFYNIIDIDPNGDQAHAVYLSDQDNWIVSGSLFDRSEYANITIENNGSGGLQVFSGTSTNGLAVNNVYKNVRSSYYDCPDCVSDGEKYYDSRVVLEQWGFMKNTQVYAGDSLATYSPSISSGLIRSAATNSTHRIRYENIHFKINSNLFTSLIPFQPGFNGTTGTYSKGITIEGFYTQAVTIGNGSGTNPMENAVFQDFIFIPYKDSVSNFQNEFSRNTRIINPIFIDSTFSSITHFNGSGISNANETDTVFVKNPRVIGGLNQIRRTEGPVGLQWSINYPIDFYTSSSDMKANEDLIKNQIVLLAEDTTGLKDGRGLKILQVVSSQGLSANESEIYELKNPNFYAKSIPVQLDTIVVGDGEVLYLRDSDDGSASKTGIMIDFADNLDSGVDGIFIGANNASALSGFNNLALISDTNGNGELTANIQNGSLTLSTTGTPNSEIVMYGETNATKPGKVHLNPGSTVELSDANDASASRFSGLTEGSHAIISSTDNDLMPKLLSEINEANTVFTTRVDTFSIAPANGDFIPISLSTSDVLLTLSDASLDRNGVFYIHLMDADGSNDLEFQHTGSIVSFRYLDNTATSTFTITGGTGGDGLYTCVYDAANNILFIGK